MIRTIITSALRNIYRNVSFSLINLTGLSLSMSLSLLIILIIKSQYEFDTYHKNGEQIYRINTQAIRTSGDVEPYASVPLAVASALNDEYALADQVVMLDTRFRGDVRSSASTSLPLNGMFANQNFLSVFNFPLAAGDATSALSRPNSIVLTHQTAQRFFGTDRPLGKILSIDRLGDFVITGVLKPFPGPTHLDFEALASFSTVRTLESNGILESSLQDWTNYYSGYAYLKLKEGIEKEDVENALSEITNKYYSGNVDLETRDKGYRFFLQSLNAITPGPVLSNNMGRGMPEILLIFLAVLAGIIMIMACFNYTQLMIAKSLTRAKEIGIRKIVGAHRSQVFMQLILEGIVFSFVALTISYLLLRLIKPGFEQLHINTEYAIDLTEDYKVFILFITFTTCVGALAGLLPAGYLSAFKPLYIMRNAGNIKIYSRLTFRKLLMITQFTLSFIFIIVIITVHRQVNYMVSANYGINENGIMNIPLEGNDFSKLAGEIANLSGVTRVAGISHPMGTWADGSSDYKRKKDDALVPMRDYSIDENFLLNIDAPFAAGRNFLPNEKNSVILNRQALSVFGFQDPASALHQQVFLGDSTELVVCGVVEDFHFRPLSYKIGPLALRYDPDNFNLLSVKITGNKEFMAAKIEAIWKKLDTRPFRWTMMNDDIDRAYEDAGFRDIVSVVGSITFIATVLSSLGMLGMVMYTTETRAKEMGVRKILGASPKDVLILLSRSFFVMLAVAMAAGTPLSLFLSRLFLQSYAYKVPFSFFAFGGAIIGLAALTTLIICSQTWRSATANTVNALRRD